ncbi:transposase [Bacillus timonensis]|nr:transposase [Bacillus timonensis]
MYLPRGARRKSNTKVYHIILRGVNRQTIFEEPEDAHMFLRTLKKFKEQCGYKIFAYCLMDNHIHLLIKEESEDLGITMRRIGASFVYWYNLKYDRIGHLFQDRYKSEPVEDVKYLVNVLRYIHQNPIKAGIVKNVSDYQWSSYSEYTGPCNLIDRDFILGIFHREQNKALSSFKNFHQRESTDEFLEVSERNRLTDKEAAEIIKRICGVTHCIDLQKVTLKDERDEYLRRLKKQGLSTRQLARLTGISRGIILRA